MTLLVTGGAGFIGSCFVRQWMGEEEEPLVVLDKLTYSGNLDSLAPVWDDRRLRFCQGDIQDGPLVQRLLRDHAVRAIVHLAAESHVDRSIDGPAPFVETNVVGTFQLLEAAWSYWQELPAAERTSFRLVHVSTDEVYGSLGESGQFDEHSPYHPNSPYAASKAAADHFVRAYHRTYGLPVIVTNCSNNYGPYQFPEKLIPLITLAALEGRPLPVYGDGRQVRDWLHVEDHCRALRLVLERGAAGQTYTIGGACERSNLDVVRAICGAVDQLCPDLPHLPCEGLIQFVPDRPGHDRRYAVDSSRMERELGWKRRYTFASGLPETVRWYVQNAAWVQRVASGQYRRERLGLARRDRDL